MPAVTPNQQQIMSAVRMAIAAFGGLAVGKGWVTKDQLVLLGSDASMTIILQIVGVLSAVAAGVWGQFAHKQANQVAAVAKMPEVAQIQTMPTDEGRALAQDVGSTTAAVVKVAGQ